MILSRRPIRARTNLFPGPWVSPTANFQRPFGTLAQNRCMFLGILFNIDELGGAYGLAAYKLLLRTADPNLFHGCYFSDGDIGDRYCIGIESSDSASLFKIEAAVGDSKSAGFAVADSRLTFDARVTNYLVPAGYVNYEGALERIENSWLKNAWDASQSDVASGNTFSESDLLSPATIVVDSSPPPSTAPAEPAIEYTPGDVIGSNYVVRDVRKGGMGIVYIVEDLKSRRKQIRLRLALKTFQSRYLWNDEAVARFEREALVWIDLGKHPNIVHAMLVERIVNRPYLWLEFIEGESLADRLARGRLATEQAVDFGLQFCRGMRHAHEQHGVIHRDIKPANTLVTGDDLLKITDFGLSKLQAELVGESLARESRTMSADDAETVTGVFVTAAGYCLGTPAYIAPEAITNPQMVDVRSDIYSFGIMLYEMLAGERPFRSANILRQHIDSIPSPVRLLNPNISIELDRVVARCLEKQPPARFQNFATLENELLHVPESRGRIELPPPDRPEVPEFGSWFMKGFSLMTFGKFDAASDCFRRAIALVPDNHEAHNNLGACLVRLNRLDDAVTATETAIKIKSDYAVAWSNLGAMYELQKRYEEGIAACRRAIELKPRWAEAHSNLGLNLARLGRTDEAKSSFYRAIAEDDSYWLAYLKLADLFTAEGSLNEALKLLQTANQISPREADLLAALAACLMDLGDQDEAAKYAERALQLDGEHPVALRLSGPK